MADCTRSSIPDDLIQSKGRFKCDEDYLIPPNTDLTGVFNDICAPGVLPSIIPATFPMTQTSYNEEFMSWKSELFTVPDDIQGTNSVSFNSYNPLCDGLVISSCSEPCCTSSTININNFTGQAFNTGWAGRTIQFFFSIYKIYCCTLDSTGSVVDFNYQYYWVKLQQIDGLLDYHCGCGTIDFCNPTFTIGQSPPCTCLFGVRNF